MCLSTGGDMHGRGHAWQGACGVGGHAWQGTCLARGCAWKGGMHCRGHAWQGGMCGRGHEWQGGMSGGGTCMAGGAWWGACMPQQILWDTVNEWAIHILLECILVWNNIILCRRICQLFQYLQLSLNMISQLENELYYVKHCWGVLIDSIVHTH